MTSNGWCIDKMPILIYSWLFWGLCIIVENDMLLKMYMNLGLTLILAYVLASYFFIIIIYVLHRWRRKYLHSITGNCRYRHVWRGRSSHRTVYLHCGQESEHVRLSISISFLISLLAFLLLLLHMLLFIDCHSSLTRECQTDLSCTALSRDLANYYHSTPV